MFDWKHEKWKLNFVGFVFRNEFEFLRVFVFDLEKVNLCYYSVIINDAFAAGITGAASPTGFLFLVFKP